MFESDIKQDSADDGSDLSHLLARAGQRVLQALDLELAPFGISFSQYMVLARLAGLGQTTIGQLARMTDTDSGAMTRLLDRLEAVGLLERSPDQRDRRVIRLKLTVHGRSVLPQIDAALARVRGAMGRDYAEPDLERFRAYLKQAVHNASQAVRKT